jgi:BNR repeat protein
VRLAQAAPLRHLATRTLFAQDPPLRRSAPSLVRLEGTGELVLAFALASDVPLSNDSIVAVSRSGDDGLTWSVPQVVFGRPERAAIPMGGLARLSDRHLLLVVGAVRYDPALIGTEPMADWSTTVLASDDSGRSWRTMIDGPRLFPGWTELYGASNPHPLADGRFLWAAIGTVGRDRGWRAGVSVSDHAATSFGPVVVIAAGADRDYSDTDIVRLADGRLLAVIREHRTLQSVQSWSTDDGKTWSAPTATPFLASNPKLHRLRSGAVLCAFRDEDPSRPGISLHVTSDGGMTWVGAGQAYVAPPDTPHGPGSLCGYPDVVDLPGRRLGMVFHGYPDQHGVQLVWLELEDLS